MDTKPALYCGTYHKYNSGSIDGAWLKLEDFNDPEGFFEACQKLHSNESDPEYMFQDFEGFPSCLYSESLGATDLEKIYAWLEFDESEREIVELYLENVNQQPEELQDALDAFMGSYSSLADYAEEYAESAGWIQRQDWPHPSNYVDWQRMGEDLETNGHFTTVRHHGDVYLFQS